MKENVKDRGLTRLLIFLVCVIMLCTMLTSCLSQTEIQSSISDINGGNDNSGEDAADEGFLRESEVRRLSETSERTTQQTAVASGESAALESYLPIADESVFIRAKLISYICPEDFSQFMLKTLRYDQLSELPSAAVELELEVYDYPNPQLPYLEDMLDIELLSADGQVIGALSKGLYNYANFEPITAAQGQTITPGWLILEVGEGEPACLRLVSKDENGQVNTAYMALPQSDAAAAPAYDFSPKHVAVGDTLADGGTNTRILGIKQTEYVFTSAVGNEYYPADNGAQLIDVLLEYEGKQINVALDVLAVAYQDNAAAQSGVTLLEQEDHQRFDEDFETIDGANRIHLVLPAPETELPVQIVFSISGTPYLLEYTSGDTFPPVRAIEKGETDTLENRYELKIDKVAYGKEVRSSVSNNKYELHEASDGNVLLIVTYRLENLSQQDIIPSRDCGAYVTYDEDAEVDMESTFYQGQVTRRAGAGDLDPAMPIKPGEISKANYAFFDVPKEAKKHGGSIWLSVCDELYRISVPE